MNTFTENMPLQRTEEGFGSSKKRIDIIISNLNDRYLLIDKSNDNKLLTNCKNNFIDNNCNTCESTNKKINILENELKKYCVYCNWCNEWVDKKNITEHYNSEICNSNCDDLYS